MKKLVTLVMLLLVNAPLAFGQSPREDLQQLIQQLRGHPEDNALRERIIRAAQEVKPPPIVPEEAERRIARGTVAFKEAKSTADYSDAAREFEHAALLAPWYADVYYNLGIARSKAEDYSGAARSLRFYLLAAPDASDAKAAKALMFEMEYKQERADKAKAEITGLAGDWRGSDGKVYWARIDGDRLTFGQRGGDLTIKTTIKDASLTGSAEANAYEKWFEADVRGGISYNCKIPAQTRRVLGRVSGDGKSIDLEYVWSTYSANWICKGFGSLPRQCGWLDRPVCDAVTLSGTSNVNLRLTR